MIDGSQEMNDHLGTGKKPVISGGLILVVNNRLFPQILEEMVKRQFGTHGVTVKPHVRSDKEGSV